MLKPLTKKLLSLQEISHIVGGELVGNQSLEIDGLSSLDEARANSISFTRESNPLKLKLILERSIPSAMLIPISSQLENIVPQMGLIKVEDPLRALIELVPHFYESGHWNNAISDKADIAPSAMIGKNVRIGAFCCIGEAVKIEDDVEIFPHVVIYPRATIGAGSVIHSGCVVREDCIIGPNNILHNGVVIGADGFGYIPDPKIGIRKVPQIGIAQIGKNVEIGANTCIDRAALGKTIVSDVCKIDNQVQIGHNVQIGSHCLICAQVGIGGSSRIGHAVTLGGQVGVADHKTVVDRARLGAGAGVITNIDTAGDYLGIPAIPAHTWKKWVYAMKIIPTIIKQLKALQRGREEI